jgi:CHAD domain-containing protein
LPHSSNFERDLEGRIQRSFRNVARIAERTSKEANVENVHDLRTSIRRLSASVGALPPGLRKKGSVRRFVKQSRKLFRTTTPLRDFDIIQSLLSPFPHLSRFGKGGEKSPERKRLATKASERARRLLRLKVPRFKNGIVDSRESKKRLASSISRSVETLRRDLPLVAGDPTRVDLLHDTRMTAKKLRYWLELLPETKVKSETLSFLENLQQSLGRVHDLDLALEYLNDGGRNQYPREVVKAVADERARAFEAFATSYDETASRLAVIVQE